MRTTLTLDSDVAIRLKKLQGPDSRSFKEIVNSALRRGLEVMEGPPANREPYETRATSLGEARIPIDSVADALAFGEGDVWR
mgnify:CR=1 FL=1